MARLGEDLIVEILIKLPVKSLVRFRCVCKTWFYMIKSPYFISRHLKHNSTKNHSCIITIRGHEDDSAMLSFHSSFESLNSVISPDLLIPHFNDISIKCYGPCNGLLCLSDGVKFVLCNPAMREFKLLPPPPFPCPKRRRFHTEAIGFGFDSIRNDYKVVTIVRLYPRYGYDYVHKVGIYNLSTNSWREIDHDVPKTSYYYADGILLNGAFHWIVLSKSKGKGKGKGIHFILYFNMSTEVFQTMELPRQDPLTKLERHVQLMVLHESLAFLGYTGYRYPYNTPEQFVDVWVMREYGEAESWTKQFVTRPITGIYHPLLLWKNKAILIESSEGRRLISCALDTHDEMNDLDIQGVMRIWQAMVYQESLISIK